MLRGAYGYGTCFSKLVSHEFSQTILSYGTQEKEEEEEGEGEGKKNNCHRSKGQDYHVVI